MTEDPRGLDAIRVHPLDTVAVALRPIVPGETLVVGGIPVRVLEPIAPGHKFAVRPHEPGDGVVKYGERIGSATAPVRVGEHVHCHNLETDLGADESYEFDRGATPAPLAPIDDGTVFDGYRRGWSGRVGTRNEIWIVNTVGCVNSSADRIARECRGALAGRDTIDGVFSFAHPFGCSQLGDDLSDTRRVLAGLASHPNAGGVLVLGLGCENNQIESLLGEIGDAVPGERIRAVHSQDVEDEIEAGVSAVFELAAIMAGDRRETCPVADLAVGIKCGGSDGFSGLTANPLVGLFCDELIARGGSVLQTEVPEMFGAERGILARAADERVFSAIDEMIGGFKRYFVEHDQPVHENPSPGNKDGGISTLEEKSLGAIQKGGRSIVTGVAAYGERASGGGLTLVNAPGNDGVSSTALTVAGATVLLFTTGRGTPLGFPAPTIKISSTSELARRKPRWIDFDAGRVLDLGADAGDLARELLGYVVEVASGRIRTRNETHDYREIAIWKRGVTL